MIEGVTIDIPTKDEITYSKTPYKVLQHGIYCDQTLFYDITHGIHGINYENCFTNNSGLFWTKTSLYPMKACAYNNNSVVYSLAKITPNRLDIGIRPILHLSDEVFDELFPVLEEFHPLSKKTRNYRIEWCYWPNSIPNLKMQEELDKAYQEHKIDTVKGVYTFNDGDGLEIKPHKVYEWKDKKYIIARATIYGEDDKKYNIGADIQIQSGDTTWIEVNPVEWLVDYETKTLISKAILMAGIPLTKSKFYNGKFEKTLLYTYLNDYMLPELFQYVTWIKKKDTEVTEVEKKNNSSDVESIISEISEYKEYYLGEEDLTKKISTIVNNYNAKVKELSMNHFLSDKELQVGYKSGDFLRNELLNNLNKILNQLKNDYSKYKDYYDMISILKEELVDSKLYPFIKNTRSVIHSKLLANESNDLESEFNEIIDKNIARIKSYIKEGKCVKASNDLEQEFRSDLQPFLVKLNDLVEKKDVVNEIMIGIEAIIRDEYIETKNQRAKHLLSIVEEVADTIRSNGNEGDLEELKKLVSFEIDYSKDMLSVLKDLNAIIKRVFRIELDINERQVVNEMYDNLIVDVDVASLLEGEKQIQRKLSE